MLDSQFLHHVELVGSVCLGVLNAVLNLCISHTESPSVVGSSRRDFPSGVGGEGDAARGPGSDA